MKSWKDKKDCSKVKNHGAGPNLLHCFNKITITTGTNFLVFFFLFFSSKCFSPGSTALQISTFMLPYGCLLRVLNIAVLVVHDDQEERGGGQEERLDENGNPSLLHNAFPIMDPQLRPLSIYRYEGRGAAFQLCCALLCGQIAHCNDETGSAYCRWYFNYPDPHNCKLDYPIHHNCKLDYEDLGSS